MPPLKQPATLRKLALAAVSEYVHTIGQMVFNAICSKVWAPLPTPEETTLKKQNFNLELLSTALYRSMPRGLWDDVTTNLLTGIFQLVRNAQCTKDGFNTTGDQRCKAFVDELIVFLIGPHVTRIDLTGQEPISLRLLTKHLDRMPHIKILTLYFVEPEDVKEHLAFLTSLISFTMEAKCTDEIVHILAHNCKKLQTLNVTESPGVTDKSVVNILKLQNLQNLQISSTKISEMGVLSILSQPKEIGGCALKDGHTLKNLQALGCDQIRNEQLHAIAYSFFRLTHISFLNVRCDFKILSQMKHLKEFKVKDGNFLMDNMAGLLEPIGHQLEILDLARVQNVDLGMIATYCVNLSTLNLCCCGWSDAPLPQSPSVFTKNEKGLPFHKLEYLTFSKQTNITFLEFILVRCFDLRHLQIGIMWELDANFISSCLSRNPLKRLELFEVYFCGKMSLRAACLLLESCPSLSVLGIYGKIKKKELDGLTQLAKSFKHKNYDINVKIKRWSVLSGLQIRV